MHRIAAVLTLLAAAALGQSKPNIIFFLTDDLGYGDVGCFWQDQRASTKKFDTPAIDTMAAEGAMLTHHYVSASVCAPSRASLIQGRHQGHSDVRNSQFDKALPDNHNISSVLKAAGYRTIHIGKDGLAGGEGDTNLTGTGSQNLASHPLSRGFDRFFGYLFHADGHEHYPRNGTTDKTAYIYDGYQQITNASVDLYTTDAWTAAAKKEIIDAAGNNQPFFLYLAYDAPHFGMQRPAIAYPAGGGLTGGIQWTTATDGSGKVRYASTANGTGTVDGFTHPSIPSGWATSEKQHVGMIRRIDESVADIIQTLKDLGIDNNTLCVFSSDNGPHNEGNNPRTFESFANMEGIKRDMWEAGIRTPTIVRWPGHISGATGNPANIRKITYPSGFWDWMPTFCQMAGVPAPALCDGVSLLPTLAGTGTQRDKGYLYFEFQNTGNTPSWTEFPNHGGEVKGEMQAIRMGNLMGVRTGITTGSEAFKIYDVTTDPGESSNLAASQPAVQAKMQALALTSRRPGAGITRPYDSLSLPSDPPSYSVPGVKWQSFIDSTASWQWVPEFRDLTPTASGTTTVPSVSVRPADDHFGILFTGYIQIPATGSYTFYLNSDTGADFFIHDGHLINDDFNHSGSVTSSAVKLAAGLHPFRLYYRHATGTRTLALDWSGPSLSRQAIPSSAFFYQTTPPPGPPSANDDTASTAYETSTLIDVLANDTDDGTPSPIAISSVDTPSVGAAAIESGKIRYTPPAGFAGVASFAYTVTDGTGTDSANVTVTVSALPPTPLDLWSTNFTGSDGANRNLVNTNGDASFTDTLTADDANLTFQDTTFTGTAFIHSGDMATGAYYSPNTNVDNPAAASPQNGGSWRSEFRYSGGSQKISLHGISFNVIWSNSSGNIQSASPGTNVRDIILSAEYSLDGGSSWLSVASPQTFDLTEAAGQDQIQTRTFTPSSPITVNHATQDLWVRIKAENTGGTAGAYVNIQSASFKGFVEQSPLALWTTSFTGSDGTNRNLVNTNTHASFTDSLAADDANLNFEDTSFSGTVFMHNGSMSFGAFYSPNTNVDNTAAASPQNGGFWETEFRYSGGTQSIELTDFVLETLWSNSSGNILVTGNNYGTSIRDITLTVQYSLDGGENWTETAPSQTYDVTEPEGADQIQLRTFSPASAISVHHSTEDLWLRVRAENSGANVGAYVDIKSLSFYGNVLPPEPDDYVTWSQSYPGANLADPDADYDNDGRTNNEERIWGLDPTSGINPSPITSTLNPTTRTLTYTRRNPSLTNASFAYEYSANLSNWFPFTPVSVSASGTSPLESTTIEVPAGIMASNFFVRILAIEN